MNEDDSSALSEEQAAARFAELQEIVLAVEDVEDFLEHLIKLAVTVLGENIFIGVTVARHGHPMTVASSDATAARFDEVQYGHDTGPCLTAMRTGQRMLVDDMAAEDRFGDYRVEALAQGVRSSLALPLSGGEHAVGAINLYSTRPHAFGEREQREAIRFADEASRALALAVRLAGHAELNAQLQQALTSRTIIDQAIGIVMGQNRCNADDAFAVLRAASQHRNVKLRQVAQEMVERIGRTER